MEKVPPEELHLKKFIKSRKYKREVGEVKGTLPFADIQSHMTSRTKAKTQVSQCTTMPIKVQPYQT